MIGVGEMKDFDFFKKGKHTTRKKYGNIKLLILVVKRDILTSHINWNDDGVSELEQKWTLRPIVKDCSHVSPLFTRIEFLLSWIIHW